MVQGGISTGRTLTDSCEIRAALPETAPLNPYCRVETPYLTQVKMLGAYTIPRIDVQLAATFQSIPGPAGRANVVYPSAVIAGIARPAAFAVTTATAG